MERFAVDVCGINLSEDLALEQRVCIRRPEPFLQQQSFQPQPLPIDDLPPLTPSACSLAVVEIQQLIEKMRDNSSFVLISKPQSTLPQSSPVGRQRHRDIRVFCNFIATQEKRHIVSVRLKDPSCRGVDVVDWTIKNLMCTDERLRTMYSDNPRHYRLFMADDSTGDEEAPIQLDSLCGNFSCFSLSPLPIAQLFLFPVKCALLPALSDDPIMVVEVKDGSKTSRRSISVPLDLAINKLEPYLLERLTNHSAALGTLKVRFGPLHLHPAEIHDFGAGCGGNEVPVGEWTVHSCSRFGVTEICINGRIVEEEINSVPSSVDGALGHLRRMDEEEARAYQQFDVVKINKFGVRQQRIIGVDGERVYNMRPLSEVGKTKNPERLIEDIEVVRDYRERPAYCEIEYNKASKYDTDRIECRNSADCIMLVEKLRMLKRIHGRRLDVKRTDTTLSRFFSRLGFGK